MNGDVTLIVVVMTIFTVVEELVATFMLNSVVDGH